MKVNYAWEWSTFCIGAGYLKKYRSFNIQIGFFKIWFEK